MFSQSGKTLKDVMNEYVELWANTQNIYTFTGKVSSLNTSLMTIDVITTDESTVIPGVKLKVYKNASTSDFMISVPPLGSNVLVGFESESSAVCLDVETCDTLYLNTGTSNITADTVNNEFGTVNTNCDSYNLDAETTTINGGSNGGLINIEILTAKINELITDINAFKTSYNTHNHGETTAPVVKTAVPSIPFISATYEDTKVLH